MNFIQVIKNLYLALSSKKKIVFFFENQTSEIHFKSLIQEIDKSEYIVVSASKNLDSKSFQVYNLRNYYFLVIFFTLIKKKVIIMTTPDLNNFYLKKTPSNRYVYLHHSMCSTHMIYNSKAFDNFDYIFNVGEYQNLEIKEREKIYKLKKKKLYNYGYGKLDYLKNNFILNQNIDEVTIAPSWNKNGEYLKFVDKIIDNLIKDYKVRFRPHKTSFKYHSKQISEITNNYKSNKNFIFDLNDNSFDYIIKAKYFITDWSGSSFEYSFFTLRPVIFMETPLKVNNLDYKKINYMPMEVSIRNKMGIILEKNEINNLREKFSKIDFEIKKYNDNILKLRNSLLFNFGESSKKGKIFLREILNEI